MPSHRRRVAWLEPSRFPYGYDDQNVYSGVLFPRAGPKMAGLLQSLGYDVEVISGETSPIDPDEIAREFDLACISTISNTATHAMILGRWLTERGLPVVMGGYQFAHGQSTPEALAPTEQALDFVPYVVRGEGYAALPQFLSALFGGGRFEDVSGLSYHTAGGRTVHNPTADLLSREAISALPLADWSAVRDVERIRVASAHGMQGCPRSCSWCAVWTRDGQRNRNTAAERFVDEIEHTLSCGRFRHVFFSADNFPVVHTWAREVCEEILRRGLRFTWTCQGEVAAALRTDLVTLMRRAGCERWCIGLESINEASLKDSGKRQNRELMEQAVEALHRQGIHIHGMFIVGLPHDTPQTLAATLAWAKRLRIETAQFLCLSDLPGSVDYERHRLWESAYQPFSDALAPLNWMFINGHYARLTNETMRLADVQQTTFELMQRFYSPLRVLQPLLWPGRTARAAARRAEGGLGARLRTGLWHTLSVAFLRLRGHLGTRRWLAHDFNRTYLKLLTAEGERAEFLRRRLLSHLPPAWLETLEQVHVERQARLGAVALATS